METIRLEELPQLIQEPINLAHLVAHNDPFNPNDKTILIVPVGASCYSVLRDFEYDIEFYDLVIARNQYIMDTDFIIEEADVISFSLVPKGSGSGKQILSIVAMIALTAAAPYAVGAMMGVSGTALTAGMGMTIGGLSGALIVGANIGIMVLGSMLISSLFKPNVPSAPSLQSFEQSTTYGWNVQGNSLAQGGSVPILYGTMRVTPQYIGKYLQTQNDAQILKGLLAVGEGPVDSINFIQINDQDITNYTDVVLETRLGTNDQTIIADFNDTWSDQGVGKKLTDAETWQYATTSGDAVTSFTVGISLPQGLFYANDSGGLNNYTVYIDIEYKAYDSVDWVSFTDVVHDTVYYYVDKYPVEHYTTGTSFLSTLSLPEADSKGPYTVYKRDVPWLEGQKTLVEYVGIVNKVPATATTHMVYPPGATYQTPNAQQAWAETVQESDVPYFSITAKQTSAIRRSFTASNLDPNKYDVRVRFYETPKSTSRYGSATYFEFLQEAISDDFIYPNTALLGVSIKATDQLSGGMPKITCIASRVTGEFGRLDNPAWASLDLLMNTRYGAGVPLTRIDMQSFSDWADFCTANNYTINIYLDQSLDLAQSLQLVGQLGRGTVMQYGSTFKALVDKPNILPTQGFLFGMGNIIQNSFSETFLPLKDRANIIEVTYYDIENNYERATIEVMQGNYDLVSQVNKTSINLLGCVSKEQALRQARYHLNQNRYLTITASWEASIDSIHCQVGDIVNVAHDVPRWGMSGRIIDFTTIVSPVYEAGVYDVDTYQNTMVQSVVVDRNDLVKDIGGIYYIQLSDSASDIQTYVEVLSVVGNVVTLKTPIDNTSIYSTYAFGQIDRHAKKMRILNISTAGDLKRRITAIEYNENVYNDSIVVPEPIAISDWSTRDLRASEYMEYSADGSIQVIVSLAWVGTRLSYDIMYKNILELGYVDAGTAYGTTFNIKGLVEGNTYEFLVDGAVLTYTVQGKLTAPDPIENLIGEESGNVFMLSWDYPYKALDFKEFHIKNDLGAVIGTTTSTKFITLFMAEYSGFFEVVAVDTTGHESTSVTITVPIADTASVINVAGSIVNGRISVAWEYPLKPIDFSHCNIYVEGVYIGNSTSETFTASAKHYALGTILVEVEAVDAAGNKSTKVSTTLAITAPTISGFSHSFTEGSVTIDWQDTVGAYSIVNYTVTSGIDEYLSAVSQITIASTWLGTRNIAIEAVDTAGNIITDSYSITVVAPGQPTISKSASTTYGIEFTWTTPSGSCGLKEYEVMYNSSTIVTKDASYRVPVNGDGVYSIQVVAIDYVGNRGLSGTSTYTVVAPSITTTGIETLGNQVRVYWQATKGTFAIKNYKVVIGGITSYTTTNEFFYIPVGIGLLTFNVTPYDISDIPGVMHAIPITIQAPAAPLVASEVVGRDAVLTITQSKRSFDLAYAEITYDSSVVNVTAGITKWSIPVYWDLSKVFSIVSVDVLGNRSTVYNEDIYIAEGEVTSVTSEVIDNNIMLRWSYTDGTLPIEHFKILKGSTYATAVEIGTRKGTFTAIFESEAGTYTYWVAPYDTAGNTGVYKSLTASVSQPPDFILNASWDSNWSGTKTLIKWDSGNTATLPVNTSETYQAHFTVNSWSTEQNQIDGGFPLWLTPPSLKTNANNTASYTQQFDYGTVLGSTSITLSDPSITKYGTGNYTMTRQISTSLDNSVWVDHTIDQMQVFITNIRYVKVAYTWVVNSNTLLEVGIFNLRLDAKIRNDSGSGAAVSTDSGGTTVNFNIPFVDVSAISVTPSGTTPLIAIYDFVDVPNPMSFKVLLYTTAGVRASGNFSWTARGY